MNNSDLDALLQQLRDSQTPAPPPVPAPTPAPPSPRSLNALLASLQAVPSSAPPPPAPPRTARDLTKLSFPESLPLLQSLALDPGFVAKVEQIRDDQGTLELRLKDERNRLEAEGKRKGLSPAMQLTKLRQWDREALDKWRTLQDDQRAQLQELNVPTFFPTRDAAALKKQERVMSVLLGFLDDDGADD